MQDLRTTVAENLTSVRKAAHLTQADLAERLNYSDKAISKWERGESAPDIFVLKEIADLFSVSVDYFLTPHTADEITPKFEQIKKRRHLTVFFTTVISVLFVATLIYVILLGTMPDGNFQWKVFVAATPLLSLLTLIFNGIWFRRLAVTVASIAGIVLTSLLTTYVFLLGVSLPFPTYFIMLPAIPLLCIVAAWYFFLRNKHIQIRKF